MKFLFFITCIIFLYNCSDTKSEQNRIVKNEALIFLNSKDYLFDTKKSKIPISIIDSLSKINDSLFKIGDSDDTGKISFSDASLGNYEYSRKLHFVLVGDTFCLMSYKEGGIGSHDIVDFFKSKGTFKHTRYVTTVMLDDTIKLRKYLTEIEK